MTPDGRSSLWKWSVCGMLLLATMLNYMDRQTLAQMSPRIMREVEINEAQYGLLERDFGFAFAFGGLFFGFLADRVRIFWLYPLAILVWSVIGYSASYAVEIGKWFGAETMSEQAFLGFRVCRIALGFCEAAQWPFALVTTSRLLSRAERSLGNSLLQSGTAVGSIFTPIVVQSLVTAEPGTWRLPFQVIGFIGLGWIIPWFLLMRPSDLSRPASVVAPTTEIATEATAAKLGGTLPADVFWRRFIVCVVMVISINLPWHFYRVWLPRFLERKHDYTDTDINYFSAGYFIAADIGCIGIGFLARWFAARGWDVHWSRAFWYGVCAAGVALGCVAATTSGVLLPTLIILVGAAGLGAFPLYYSFSQDLSGRHQGKISGTLGFTTWMVTGQMQGQVGNYIKTHDSYVEPMMFVSLMPLFAFVVLLLVWKQWPPKQPVQ